MTEKRFFILQLEDDDLPCIRDRTFQLDDIYGHYKYDNLEQLCSFLNEQHETIRTLGIATAKILQTIKDDKESHAMIMCVEVLKKLEENGFDLE